MTCPSVVRLAGPADKVEILRLFLQAHHENGMFPHDIEKVHWWISRMTEPELIPPNDTGTRGAIGVIGEPKHLEGLALITFGCFWYTNHRHLEEWLVYVDPVHRKSRHARTLIDWMKRQSVETGLPLMTGVLSLREGTELKVQLYERMLPKAGSFFFYNPIEVSQGSTVASYVH